MDKRFLLDSNLISELSKPQPNANVLTNIQRFEPLKKQKPTPSGKMELASKKKDMVISSLLKPVRKFSLMEQSNHWGMNLVVMDSC